MNSDTKTFLKKFNKKEDLNYIEKKEQIILTTRARIARNLSNFRFNSASSKEEKREIYKLLKEAFYSSNSKDDFKFFSVARLNKVKRFFLVEEHILSPEMLSKINGRGVIVRLGKDGFDRSLSILINEEDHLRIQSIYPGLDIGRVYMEVSNIEKDLSNRLRFAYDSDFGYLTSCPTNVGTSLRLSIIAHLPAIVAAGKIEEFIENLINIGCSIRGYYGENSDIFGNLFQISNQVSLGRYEKQIIEDMRAICLNIIDEEKDALKAIREKNEPVVEDSIYRSYGMLKFARMLSYGEALELISMIKLGQDLDIIEFVKPFDFYQLISLLGESNIILASNKDLRPGSNEVDKMRACIIREKILKRN